MPRYPSVKGILIRGIHFYREAVSPLTPPACRFLPTCSAYALEAVERYGALQGSWLTLKRFCRCHPLGGHGFDPVPESGRGSGRTGGDGAMSPRKG